MGSGGVPLGRYRLRTTMTPLAGQPVNWPADLVDPCGLRKGKVLDGVGARVQ